MTKQKQNQTGTKTQTEKPQSLELQILQRQPGIRIILSNDGEVIHCHEFCGATIRHLEADFRETVGRLSELTYGPERTLRQLKDHAEEICARFDRIADMASISEAK